MNPSRRSFTPAQASAALGVSAKALRLYEQHGLLTPDRTRTGWRTYDAGVMARAAEIVALRSLGLSLAQVARVLDGNPRDLDLGLSPCTRPVCTSRASGPLKLSNGSGHCARTSPGVAHQRRRP